MLESPSGIRNTLKSVLWSEIVKYTLVTCNGIHPKRQGNLFNYSPEDRPRSTKLVSELRQRQFQLLLTLA